MSTTLQNGACVKLENFKCIGVIPENAMLIPGDDQSLPQDTEISLVPFNTPAKCEYICKLRDFVYDASTKKCKPSSSWGWENHVKKCSPNLIVPSNLTANCQFETSEFNCLKHAGRDWHSRYGGALSQGQDLGIRLDGTRHPWFIVEFFEGKPKWELATYIWWRNPAYYRLESVCIWE